MLPFAVLAVLAAGALGGCGSETSTAPPPQPAAKQVQTQTPPPTGPPDMEAAKLDMEIVETGPPGAGVSVTRVPAGGSARVKFNEPGAADFLGDGWGAPEQGGRWSVGETAEFYFSLDGINSPTVKMMAYTLGPQEVTAEFNGEPIEMPELSSEKPGLVSLTIPADRFVERDNKLVFSFPGRASPQEVLGKGSDRLLGIRVRWIEVTN